MFDIGFGELLICAIVALLVLGPERLPAAARTVGRWVGRARHTVNHFTDQIDREIRAEELKRRIEEEMKKSGIDDVTRQVNEAMRAPLPLVGADHLREPQNSIAPPKQEAVPEATSASASALPAPESDATTPTLPSPAQPAPDVATPDKTP